MWNVGQTVYWADAEDVFVRGIISVIHSVTNLQGTKQYYTADYNQYGPMQVIDKLESFFFSTIEEAIADRDRATQEWEDSV